jgi:hypothetical protein
MDLIDIGVRVWTGFIWLRMGSYKLSVDLGMGARIIRSV